MATRGQFFESSKKNGETNDTQIETTGKSSSDSESEENMIASKHDTVSCLGVSVPCADGLQSSECPLLEVVALDDIQQFVVDKEYTVESLPEFAVRQEHSGFKKNTHYWFIIRGEEADIRYIAPYADDVVDFFEEHYYIENIGHTSVLPMEEFIASYNVDSPGKFVVFAGTFSTNENGKIVYWSNDARHFDASQDYAAPVAEAMGIKDAMFIPWVGQDQDQSIFYRQYKDYTGAYHAKGSLPNFIDQVASPKYIFYPHDYHAWYKYHHGQKDVHHHAHHGFGLDAGIGFLWLALFIAVLCCMIGILIAFILPKSKRGLYQQKVMVLSDISEENATDEENENENMVNM